MTRGKPPSRQEDERDLGWLRARAKGHTIAEVAQEAGFSTSMIINTTNGIRKSDMYEIIRESHLITEQQLQAELDSHRAAYWGRGRAKGVSL